MNESVQLAGDRYDAAHNALLAAQSSLFALLQIAIDELGLEMSVQEIKEIRLIPNNWCVCGSDGVNGVSYCDPPGICKPNCEEPE